MTPQRSIAVLDRHLAMRGETVRLRHTGSADGEAVVLAFVRGIAADEIAGAITQTDRKVTVSPTGLETFGLPVAGGFVVIGDYPKAIVGEPEIIRMADVVVRINMVVKG